MKILYITTIGSTMWFFRSLIKRLIDEGNVVDIATNDSLASVNDCYKEWGCNIYSISTSRSPFSFGNIKAINEIRNIAKGYDLVHCHTPLAGMATRIACRKLRKKGEVKVFYTAHGFHFYKGAPIKNWIIFYPIEKICSKWTDVLITINKEDYSLAKRKMKAKNVIYIPGVGIDFSKFSKDRFSTEEIDVFRKSLNVNSDEKMLLSIGELTGNKNHKVVIEALSQLNDEKYKYFIVGRGDLDNYLKTLVNNLGMENKVFLLGFRTDIPLLCASSDIFIFPSIREGLPVSLMEAIASGLPTIASRIRGNVDLLNEENSYLCNPRSVDDFKNAIKTCLHETKKYGKDLLLPFSMESVNAEIIRLYNNM